MEKDPFPVIDDISDISRRSSIRINSLNWPSVPAGKISQVVCVCWSTKISSCVVCNFVEHCLKVKMVGYDDCRSRYLGYYRNLVTL